MKNSTCESSYVMKMSFVQNKGAEVSDAPPLLHAHMHLAWNPPSVMSV